MRRHRSNVTLEEIMKEGWDLLLRKGISCKHIHPDERRVF